MKDRCIKVENDSLLLPFLTEQGYAKNKAKSLLKYDNIWVDNKVVRQGNFELKKGNVVRITKERKVKPPFSIIYEDSEFLVINKKEKLLTVATTSSENSAYKQAKSYLKAKNSREELFLLHRLDKETSGVLVFCKSKTLTKELQDNWQKYAKKRLYIAVVEGSPKQKEGRLEFYLQERGEKTVLIVDNPNFGKKAITEYQTIRSNKNYSLLEVEIKTGRKNQIRASFAHIGHPVTGDKKYYAEENPLKRTALIANELILIHPYTKKEYKFTVEVPKSFLKIVS